MGFNNVESVLPEAHCFESLGITNAAVPVTLNVLKKQSWGGSFLDSISLYNHWHENSPVKIKINK